MQDADESKPETGRTAEGRRKRPPVTIDLEADAVTELEQQRAESAASDPAYDPEVTTPPEPEMADGQEPAEPVPQLDPENGPEAEAVERRRAGAARYLPVIAAGILGGIVGGVLVAFITAPSNDTVQQASTDSRFATLAARVDHLEAQSGAAPAAQIDDSRLKALETKVAELAAAPPASAEAPPAVDLAPLEARIAALEDRPVPVATPRVDLTPLDQRIDALKADLDRLEANPPSDPKTEAAALTIALASLRQAAAAGGPFADQLGAYTALGGKAEALVPLASAGAPALAALQGAFPAIADRIRTEAAKADPNASVWQRLAASAGALVTVKPAGPIEGAAPAAVLSRMEAAVAHGDLAAALRESEGLDQSARASLADWAEGARRRIAINAALSALPPAGASNG